MYQNEFAQEFEQETLGYEQEGSSYEQQEMFEFNPEFMGELSGEAYEMNGEQYELSGELNETQELELAHQLLEVSNEEELNMFLGNVFRGIGRAVSNFARSPIGRGIGNALKSVARTALPIAGKVLGSFVGGPVGGMIGGKLGSAASNLFELELEGLSPEDREFETARAFVRFAHSAARRGASLQQRGLPPQQAVRTALGQAARQHAPGLLRQSGPRPRDARGRFMAAGQRPGSPAGFAGRRPGAGQAAPFGQRRPGVGGSPATRPGGFNGGASTGANAGGFGGARFGQPGLGPNFTNFNFGGSNLAASGGSALASNQGGDFGADFGDDGYDAAPDFGGADGPDQGGFADGGQGGFGAAPRRATRGTWQRQGNTIVLQL